MITEIPFTQFLRPNGRRTDVTIERPREILDLAEKFILAGGWFECEQLSSGHAHLTACFKTDDGDDDIFREIVDNGPPVLEAVDRLVRNAVAWLPG